jgi:ribonucleoside-diphosphate reductase beta chain
MTRTHTDPIEVAQAADLAALADTPIDDVIGVMDRVPLGYRDLYYRWERQQWEAGAIDFGRDQEQWASLDAVTRSSLLWWLAPFYVGEEQVTNSLVPFVDAALTEEQGVFLTTQLVDEARHTVFFDRFVAEVAEESGEDMEGRLAVQERRLDPEFRRLMLEELPAAAERIRSSAGDHDALIQGVVLYHLLIEGVLALSGQRFLLNFLREHDLLPGFRSGFTAVARDESRHVSFGVLFLKEMASLDVRYETVVRDAVVRYGPTTLAVIDPTTAGDSFPTLPYGPGDLVTFARDSLRKRLRAIGVEVAV